MDVIITIAAAGICVIVVLLAAIAVDKANNRAEACELEARIAVKEMNKAMKAKEEHRKEAAKLRTRIDELEAQYVSLQSATSQAEEAAGQWADKLNACELERFNLTNDLAQAMSEVPEGIDKSQGLTECIRQMAKTVNA
jgi:uncharacterized protein YhaN